MAYLNSILQLPMALLLLAQLLVMATAWFTNAVTIWQRLSMTFAALVLAGGHLVIMYGFGLQPSREPADMNVEAVTDEMTVSH